MHRRGFQRLLVLAQREDLFHACGREAGGQIAAELGFQQRDALGAATAVAHRVFHFHLLRGRAVLEEDLQGIGDGALVGLQVLAGVARLLDHFHLLAQLVDDGVRLVESVLVVLGHQIAERQRHGRHVLQAMVTVGRIVERAALADDADGGLVGVNDDAVDLVKAILHQRVQAYGSLGGSLGMELGGEGDLEENLFHHIRAVIPCKR